MPGFLYKQNTTEYSSDREVSQSAEIEQYSTMLSVADSNFSPTPLHTHTQKKK